MAKANSNGNKIAYVDEVQKNYNIFKDGVRSSIDSITAIHKQTLDSSSDYYEKVTKSQDMEKKELYDIIKTSNDKEKCAKAWERLEELDCIANERVDKHNESIQNERDIANKNITGILISFAVAGGFIVLKNKQFGQSLLSIKNSIITK